MANYLMTDGVPGLTGISATNPPSKKGIQVDSIYKTHIRNKTGTLSFSGYVPTDFQISLSAGWQPIFSGSLSDFAGGGGGVNPFKVAEAAFGGSARVKALTGQIWTEPAYLQISLPIILNAYSDTKKEIIDSLVNMTKLVTPNEAGQVGEGSLGALTPPGPVPALAILDQISTSGNGNVFGISEEFEFICQVGRFFRMSPCIITNVVAAFDGQMEDETGNPLSVDFNLELTSYFAVTQQDIEKWFAGNFGNIAGASKVE